MDPRINASEWTVVIANDNESVNNTDKLQADIKQFRIETETCS